MKPFRVLPSFREKVWGHTELEPWFRRCERPVGEVWFTFDENRTEFGPTLAELSALHGPSLLGENRCGDFPILTKFLFTGERLSIQVHPDDDYARGHHQARGKTEMWHVLRAEPESAIAVGFKEKTNTESVRRAALDGSLEDLIRWVPVRAGDTIFCPAGTVHAIGAGLAICEIQQNSDITYRLYDYGRPRELHLEESLQVATLEPHPGIAYPLAETKGRKLLALCDHFATELLEYFEAALYEPDHARIQILMVIEGTGTLDGRDTRQGEVWVVPASAEPFQVLPDSTLRVLRTFVP